MEDDWLCLKRDPLSSLCLLLGTQELREPVKDTLYLRSCRAHGVVPVSRFLRQGRAPELNLRHRGLGPQVLLEGPWGQACRDGTWEAAAMGVAPFLSLSHTLPGFALGQA